MKPLSQSVCVPRCAADADIDDDKLGSCGEKELNKRSQIKNKVNEAIDK